MLRKAVWNLVSLIRKHRRWFRPAGDLLICCAGEYDTASRSGGLAPRHHFSFAPQAPGEPSDALLLGSPFYSDPVGGGAVVEREISMKPTTYRLLWWTIAILAGVLMLTALILGVGEQNSHILERGW